MNRRGNLLATGSDDGRVRLYDIETKKKLIDFEAHNDGVGGVLFHGDNDAVLVTCGSVDGNILDWDIRDMSVGPAVVRRYTGAPRINDPRMGRGGSDERIYRGGAVKISGSTSRFSFEHVVFEGNRQTDNIALDRFDEYTHSGAALASGPSTVVDLSFANCSFLGNAARKYAGAVYLGAKTKSAVFDSCIFRGNTALLGGDDVYVKDGVGEGAVKIVDAVGLFFFLFFIWSALYALRYTEKTYSLMPLLPIIHNSSVTHQHFSVFSSVCFLSCFISLSLSFPPLCLLSPSLLHRSSTLHTWSHRSELDLSSRILALSHTAQVPAALVLPIIDA